MSPVKVIMASGRVYHIKNCDKIRYSEGWASYKTASGERIVDLWEENIEAEIWRENDLKIENSVHTNIESQGL